MNATLYDRQESNSPLNGTKITHSDQLRSVLSTVRDREPFFAELIGDNGFKLLLGLGSNEGCVQFSSVEGDPPYLMAVAPRVDESKPERSFLIGNTPTPIPARFALPSEVLLSIAGEFIDSGGRSEMVTWEEI